MSATMLIGRLKIAGKSHWVSVTLESENPHNLKPPEDINAVFTLPISVNNSTHNFLIDSGADVSVLPKFIFQPDDRTVTVQMKSANNSDIKVYGKRTLLFQIEDFYNTFSWTFIVADVNKPILGSDFLAKYKLMVNCSSKKIFRLEDNMTSDNQSYLRIETTGIPISQRARKMASPVLQTVKSEFSNLLKTGVIVESHSDWASPIVAVKKKDGTFRPCGDYRYLNAKTKPDRYPLPRITDILDQVQKCKIFSTIDIEKAYHHIPIHPYDRHKIAVITPFGLFEYTSMPFGLRNAAQTFQRYMDRILRKFKSFALPYIDDILIFSIDENTHKTHREQILEALRDAKLTINEKKCQNSQTNVEFLGFNISEAGIQPSKLKIDHILQMSTPDSVKALRRFIGAIMFYQWMLPNLSEIMAPLHDLIADKRKSENCKFKWTTLHNDAFEKTKICFKNIVAMTPPDHSKKFILCTDASGTAIGGSLNHIDDLNRFKPIAFFSRKLNIAERKYSTFDRELL